MTKKKPELKKYQVTIMSRGATMLEFPRWKVDVTVGGDVVKTFHETATTSAAAIAKAKHKMRGAVSSAGAFKFKATEADGAPVSPATKKSPAQLQREIDEVLVDKPLQESTSKKATWLKGVKRRFPLGARVRVVKSDVPEYIGARGKVIDYSLGTEGEWPLISIGFDAPIKTSEWGTAVKHDAFYGDGTSDDEIVLDRAKRKA